MNLPLVSVIVVNFNGRHLLAECLESLAAQDYPKHLLEVIVVDNASGDGSEEFVRGQFPWVKLIAAGQNLGFAAGNNAGLAIARGEWIALLNNDATAEPQWLRQSVAAGTRTDTIGGVAAHIVFRNEPGRINSTGLVVLRDGRGADRDFGKSEAECTRPAGEVFGGCGAGLVLRRAMLDEIGLFDPALFMYYEDLDLAWRARYRGWRFVYEPSARVHHHFGATAGYTSPWQAHYVQRNRCLVNIRHAPLSVAAYTVIASMASTVRSLWRQPTHFVAQASAMFGVFFQAHRFVLDRRRTRCDAKLVNPSQLRSWLGRD